ncbi:MAG: hypothetical protein HZB46_09010 [Solirubrobacterales bacterium]|nr:hypothetical protein [Solirubrobacterales bacterium]
MDQATVALTAPLPGDDLEAELTWRAPRGGLRPGDQDVGRAEATHAVLRTKGLDDRWRERRLTVEEADAYLAEVAAMRDRHARLDGERAQRIDADRAAKAQLAASIVPTCPYCHVPRAYAGRRNLVSLGSPEHVARSEGWQLTRPETTALHEYRCPRCGSAELFAAGALEHPLPGAAPA